MNIITNLFKRNNANNLIINNLTKTYYKHNRGWCFTGYKPLSRMNVCNSERPIITLGSDIRIPKSTTVWEILLMANAGSYEFHCQPLSTDTAETLSRSMLGSSETAA